MQSESRAHRVVCHGVSLRSSVSTDILLSHGVHVHALHGVNVHALRCITSAPSSLIQILDRVGGGARQLLLVWWTPFPRADHRCYSRRTIAGVHGRQVHLYRPGTPFARDLRFVLCASCRPGVSPPRLLSGCACVAGHHSRLDFFWRTVRVPKLYTKHMVCSLLRAVATRALFLLPLHGSSIFALRCFSRYRLFPLDESQHKFRSSAHNNRLVRVLLFNFC